MEGYGESLCSPDMEFAIQGKPERNFTDTFAFLNGSKFQYISIKGFNGKYVSADRNINNKLVADRPVASSWETFKIRMPEFGKCTFMTSDNKFVSAKFEGSGNLIADRDYVFQNEIFFHANI